MAIMSTRYKTAISVGLRHAADLKGPESIRWCTENFGESGPLVGRWMPLQFTIQFRDRKDRDWYLLKWT